MIFTIPNIINSLAGVLKAQCPTYPVYASANQQGTKFPCFFVFLMPSTVEAHLNDHAFRDIGIDIIFVQQRNIPNGNMEIQEIQEFLDYSLETFTYSDGSGETALIHTFERQASTEDQELHYQFHIRERVAFPKDYNPMKEMEDDNVEIKRDDDGI